MPVGLQDPDVAVSVEPTAAKPLIFGTAVFDSDPEATGLVGFETLLKLEYPLKEPVTRREMSLPLTPAVSTYVLPVAPAIAAPSANQVRVVFTPLGVQAPLYAVNVDPTLAIPEIVGILVFFTEGKAASAGVSPAHNIEEARRRAAPARTRDRLVWRNRPVTILGLLEVHVPRQPIYAQTRHLSQKRQARRLEPVGYQGEGA
ncbi:MAG: hypothetical protein ABIR57_02735 [Aeromicrobium sp.]